MVPDGLLILIPRLGGTVTLAAAALVEASEGATNCPALFLTEA